MRPSVAEATGEDDLLGVVGQPLAAALSAAMLGQVEDTLDICLRGAGTHDPRARATAEQQVERVGEHRLAGAGLAREHVQPGRQPQLRALDQQEVLDVQLLQARRQV